METNANFSKLPEFSKTTNFFSVIDCKNITDYSLTGKDTEDLTWVLMFY